MPLQESCDSLSLFRAEVNHHFYEVSGAWNLSGFDYFSDSQVEFLKFVKRDFRAHTSTDCFFLDFTFKFSVASFFGYRVFFSVARKAMTSSIFGSDMFSAVSIATLGLGCAEFRMFSSVVSRFVKRDSHVILARCPFS